MNPSVIEVRAWGRRVGAVALDPARSACVFEFDPKWVKRGIDLAPRTMPIRSGQTLFAFPNLPEATFHRLPGMLADALPDAFGNALIDAWMQGKGVDRARIGVLDRLAYMGKRGLGALEFHPATGSRVDGKDALEMAHLIESARSVILAKVSTDKEAITALAQIIRVGTSAGGARAKAVIAWNPETHEIRSGQFDVPEGFEHWLLKFDGMGPDSELGITEDFGRIEYAYYLMARAAGIEMSPSRLFTENGRAHFMTKRFDRDGNLKHHVQTLCAMEHMDYKQRATHGYAQAFMAIAALGIGQDGLDELFRRMVLNVVCRNHDDHTKNCSFILKQDQDWALAPAYDVTHAYNPRGEWTSQHLMHVNGKFTGITRQDLTAEASRFGIRRADEIIARVLDVARDFRRYAMEAGLPDEKTELIARDFCWI